MVQHLLDRGQAADAHRRRRSCGRPAADRGGYAHVAYDATPVHLATGTRLPPVNTTRANVGQLGGNDGVVAITCRIAAGRLMLTGGADVWASGCRIAAKRLTLTGGTDRVGISLPGTTVGLVSTCPIAASGYVATPGHWPQRPRTLEGRTAGCGGGNRGPCRIAAKRLRRDAGAVGHRDATSARERGTGERRDAGQHLPDRGQAARSRRRGLYLLSRHLLGRSRHCLPNRARDAVRPGRPAADLWDGHVRALLFAVTIGNVARCLQTASLWDGEDAC